jgi:hypothetical protein
MDGSSTEGARELSLARASISLDQVCELNEYRTCTAHLFRSEQSLQWFVRQHKSDLVKQGALLFHAGKWWAHRQQFDSFVLLQAQRDAMRRCLHESDSSSV